MREVDATILWDNFYLDYYRVKGIKEQDQQLEYVYSFEGYPLVYTCIRQNFKADPYKNIKEACLDQTIRYSWYRYRFRNIYSDIFYESVGLSVRW